MREAVTRLAERARTESWTHEEFLVACLQREVSARESHGGEGRIRAARFPSRKSLEEFDFSSIAGVLSTQPNTMTAARRSQRKNGSGRTLVLMATMRSSANDSQDQTISRAHLRQEHSTSASDRTRFSRIHGAPQGPDCYFEAGQPLA